MLVSQQFIITHGLASLKEQFAIRTNRHAKYPNLVQLKYSQSESSMRERIVQECRGLILDEENNWEIVCYPFDKFFNYNEALAAKIDWSSASIFEKVDGSFMMLYFYAGEWIVASSGIPDASGNVNKEAYSFAELFWQIWEEEAYSLPVDKNYCYFFEMVHPSNRVLVTYEKGELFLIGARNLQTLKEAKVENTGNLEWKRAKNHAISSLEELIEISHQLDPLKQEGFIVCDQYFNRIKIKSPQYVKLSLLESVEEKIADRYLLEIIQVNEGDEFLSYFEKYRKRYEALRVRYDQLIQKLELMYEDFKEIEDRKRFAQKVTETKYAALFFKLKDGKVSSVKAYLKNFDSKRLMNDLAD